jgi:hypothetical protein
MLIHYLLMEVFSFLRRQLSLLKAFLASHTECHIAHVSVDLLKDFLLAVLDYLGHHIGIVGNDLIVHFLSKRRHLILRVIHYADLSI